MQEINVYVIENEQPFENWFGIWKYYQTINGVSGFYVENNKGELILVHKELVYEAETNMEIDDFIKYSTKLRTLTEFGLSKEESEYFISMLNKMKMPSKYKETYNKELLEAIPFEGGFMFYEALCAILDSQKKN